MNVQDIVLTRRSIRSFRDTPVDVSTVIDCCTDALWAPSASNIQPFYIDIVSGEKRNELVHRAELRFKESVEPDPMVFEMYPPDLPAIWEDRRKQIGGRLYSSIGIGRTDKDRREQFLLRNLQLFDAPVVVFISLPIYMGPVQWADAGIYLQTLMLLLQERGLGSCPQAVWGRYHTPVRQTLGWSDDRILYCGLSIGIPDDEAPVNSFARQRATVAEMITTH